MDKQKKAKMIATFFYVGYWPKAPGTWGSLMALPAVLLFLAIAPYLDTSGRIFLGLAIALPVFHSGRTSIRIAAKSMLSPDDNDRRRKLYDRAEFVIDEVLGLFIAAFPLAWVPLSQGEFWYGLLLSFVLFRVFDIAKPWPISRIDEHDAPFCVMMDDAAAGVFAAVLTGLFLRYF